MARSSPRSFDAALFSSQLAASHSYDFRLLAPKQFMEERLNETRDVVDSLRRGLEFEAKPIVARRTRTSTVYRPVTSRQIPVDVEVPGGARHPIENRLMSRYEIESEIVAWQRTRAYFSRFLEADDVSSYVERLMETHASVPGADSDWDSAAISKQWADQRDEVGRSARQAKDVEPQRARSSSVVDLQQQAVVYLASQSEFRAAVWALGSTEERIANGRAVFHAVPEVLMGGFPAVWGRLAPSQLDAVWQKQVPDLSPTDADRALGASVMYRRLGHALAAHETMTAEYEGLTTQLAALGAIGYAGAELVSDSPGKGSTNPAGLGLG